MAQQNFRFRADCCVSCHIDNEEADISMCYIDVEEGYYEVCCAVKHAYELKEVDK